MKKLLLITGMILIIACILSLLFALLNYFGYYHVLDGSASLYAKLHRRMILFLVLGIVLGIAGAVCIVTRTKL